MNQPAITLSPYAEAMKVRIHGWDQDAPSLALDYHEELRGNPGMFHGGALGGLLELAALAALEAHFQARGSVPTLQPINSTIEYLRPAIARPIHARGKVIRAGRRLASVQVDAWQDNAAKPVTIAFVNVQILPA